jgi:hypothetical protein
MRWHAYWFPQEETMGWGVWVWLEGEKREYRLIEFYY